MIRSKTLEGRAGRVLALAERALHEWLGPRMDARTLALHHAFRWRSGSGRGHLVPISDVAAFALDDLIGVDRVVEALDRNTRQFMAGLPFNNVLLHGERGTGKSSAVRGILTRHAAAGLRLVEMEKRDLAALPELLRVLRQGAGLHFIVFCDDLSFGEGEPGFRELKAALEGGLEAAASNVCIVATSNRRHLLPETMAENRQARVDEHGELHLGEALEEKLALADRFGLSLGFYSIDQDLYLAIVSQYLEQGGVEMDEAMRREALRWALARGTRSGRTARQFSDDALGRLALEGA